MAGVFDDVEALWCGVQRQGGGVQRSSAAPPPWIRILVVTFAPTHAGRPTSPLDGMEAVHDTADVPLLDAEAGTAPKTSTTPLRHSRSYQG